ncbi:iron complex transport system substrate-binding protein [Kerstersia gyiorum]|uniref:Iron complex transport system substrate-binding protein n=1 Tax=Kerstersia gyiorum TaxID=206506 RepID=A0A4Q7N1Z3_9BURK|nr:ABC transporter substrate-binding protein [Kerstersia gyiorum]KAB0545103.1 ABC transporter substrate-binding protein [Kerstersia gyiorum]RZS73629.1 iron complex transport system substrate-binding protein [Kerstersia gyiorum]
MKKLLVALLGAAFCAGAQAAPERIVSLGGTVTEIIYDLGHGDSVVASDISSIYPPAVQSLPRVGYYRTAPVEGIAAMQPDLILASEQAGPQQTFKRLSDLGIKVVQVSDGHSIESLFERIDSVADALDDQAAGKALAEKIRTDLDASLALPETPLSALFIMVRTSKPSGAGNGTAVNEVLKLAGLKNAMAEQQGYKTLSAEGVIQLAPEMIVTTTMSLEAVGGMEKFLQLLGVSATPAAKAGRVLALDDLLIMGMGPRLPEAVRSLKEAAAKPATGSSSGS